MKLKKCLVAVALATALAVPLSASAAPVVELALVVDASGSISSSNWALQMQGYANAVNSVLPTDGSVAVSVIRFGETASVVYGMTTIADVAARAALSDFLTNLSQSGDGFLTCISCGIFQAEGTFSGSATRSIIDVSTDGFWNVGVNPAGPSGTVGTSAWAVEVGKATVVNAIGIGINTAPDFAYGPGSFSLLAANFQEFGPLIAQKIQRETGQVPEPGTLALLGIGLAGLGALRRRKLQA